MAAAIAIGVVAAILVVAWVVRRRLPPLADSDIDHLVAEYVIADAIGDEPRVHEILRDLRHEGVVLRMVAGCIEWERG